MLTRTAVAKLLRRSLATVRRLEGRELFPWLDNRGIHRFDAREIAKVARRLRRGEVTAARSPWLSNPNSQGRQQMLRPPARGGERPRRAASSETRELAALRIENAELRKALARLCAAIESD